MSNVCCVAWVEGGCWWQDAGRCRYGRRRARLSSGRRPLYWLQFPQRHRQGQLRQGASTFVKPTANLFRHYLQQASHWHEICSRSAPQYGVPSRAISLWRRQGDAQFAPCRVMSCRVSRISYELLTKCVTPNLTLEINFWTFQNFRHDVTRTTLPDLHPHTYCHEFFPHCQFVTPNCVPWCKPLVSLWRLFIAWKQQYERLPVDLLAGTDNYMYSAASKNMKLVHRPLMGGLLHLVQRVGEWAGRSR